MAQGQVRVAAARPTIFFKTIDGKLTQGYDLDLENGGGLTEAPVTASWGDGRVDIGKVEAAPGSSSVRVFVPDIRQETVLKFSVGDGHIEVDHKPGRHWKVHVIQFAHHDLGYTDIPTNVLKELDQFLGDALRFCRETDDWPEESRFRYSIEQGWSLLHFLETADASAREEMLRRLREGRLEVNAFIGNQITELQGPEEMIRMMYPLFELKRRHGVPILAAEHNDIPGISWGVASAMAAAGVRFFVPALPDYFRWGEQYHTFWDEDAVVPGGRPHAFWWEAPNGKKVLFFYHWQGAGGPIDVRLPGLADELQKLEGTDYPYDVLRYQVRGGDRDNSNTRLGFARTCREWNEQWAYPQLIQSVNSMFFNELEKQLSGDLPVFRGELPATDYSAASNCTAYPSSINRRAHDRMLAAERLATLASAVAEAAVGKEYLDEGYEQMLMNDEHCWGLAHPTGPGMEACLAQHNEHAYRAASIADDILQKSLYRLADDVEAPEDAHYALIFNPLNWTRSDVAVAPVRPMEPSGRPMRPEPGAPADPEHPESLYYNYPVSNHGIPQIGYEKYIQKGLRVIDVSTGAEVPHDVYEVPSPDAPVPYAGYRYNLGEHNRAERLDVRFMASDVPPMGYKLYRLEPAEGDAAGEAGRSSEANGAQPYTVEPSAGAALENQFYRVELHQATGAVKSIFDKDLGRELVDSGADYGLNQVVLRSSITAGYSTSGSCEITRGHTGPLTCSLVVRTSAPGYPQIVQEIILHANTKRIDFNTRMLKDSTGHLETYVAFPFDLHKPQFNYEGSLAVVEPMKDQFPGSNTHYYAVQHWASASDGEASVVLSSHDAPMMQFGGNWPLYVSQAHHGVTRPDFDEPFVGPEAVEKGHIYSFVLLNNYRTNFSPVQTGEVLFRFSMTSHSGGWDADACREFGYGVSLPLEYAGIKGPQTGTLPASNCWLEVDGEGVVLLAFKLAEDGRGHIVRVMETGGRARDIRIRTSALAVREALLTNAVEEDLSPLSVEDGSVPVHVGAWDVVTVRLVD